MLSPLRTSSLFLPALAALLLLMATGCAKEDVVAPCAAHNTAKQEVRPGQGNGNGTVDTGNGTNGNSPITDDGDDIGDNERTSSPK